LLGEPLSGDPATVRTDVVRLSGLLVARIRDGSFDAGAERGRLVALLRRITVRKLEISNPQFLEAARRRSRGSAVG
jgi:hypothetical protein